MEYTCGFWRRPPSNDSSGQGINSPSITPELEDTKSINHQYIWIEEHALRYYIPVPPINKNASYLDPGTTVPVRFRGTQLRYAHILLRGYFYV